MSYKAVLFGSIGTLVETSDLQRDAFNEAFKISGSACVFRAGRTRYAFYLV